MFIYPSSKTVPYVYKLTHKESGKFYFGCRFANNAPSSADIGIHYFTSSKLVKPIFHEFDIEIVAEFFDKTHAHEFEQSLIMENWGNPNLLNKNFIRNSHLICNQNYKCPIRSKKISDALTGGTYDGSSRKGKCSYYNVVTQTREWTTVDDQRLKTGELVTIAPRFFGKENHFFGKSHSKDSMMKMVESRMKSGNGDYHHGKMTQDRKDTISKISKLRMNTNNPMKNPIILEKVSKLRSSFDHWFKNYFLRKPTAPLIINSIKEIVFLPTDRIIREICVNKRQKHYIELIEKIKDGSLPHPKEGMPCALSK